MLISMGTTLICEIIAYIYKMINGASIEVLTFLKIVLIEIIFNLMIIIIIYPLIRKLGEKLEQVFNEDKILTKYF
ncbi:unknown [Clostridium sp. CAG:452]|nr:unknown [Clostridium sp. CAG:452]